MQRFLGGLSGVLVDIRWVGYKKTHWQESGKMYRWGHQLSRGNVVEVPNGSEQCTHTQTRRRDALMEGLYRVVAVVAVAFSGAVIPFSGAVIPNRIVWDDPCVKASQRVHLTAGIIMTVASTVSCLHLGRERRLLICNCGCEKFG